MNVLITGGAGFIGGHVARALQARGDRVSLLDDFNPYYDPRLKRARVRALLGDTAPVREGDIADSECVERIVREESPAAILHLAAWAGVGPSRTYPDIFARANLVGTVNVFAAASRLGVRRVLFASSSSVYGPSAPVPTSEEALAGTPLSGYGITKLAGELYATLYRSLEGLPVTALRFFTVYGPWGRPDMAVWRFTEQILRGEPILLYERDAKGALVCRDFTEVSDVVRGVLAVLDASVSPRVLNIGGAEPVPLGRLLAVIEQAIGKPAQVRKAVLPPDQVTATGARVDAATAAVGYRPQVRLEDGVRRFVDWYRSEFRRVFPEGLAVSSYWT